MLSNLIKEYKLYLQNRAVRVVVAVRILGYFLLFINPLAGMIVSIYLDVWDYEYFMKHKVNESWYYRIDKVVDYLEYLILIPVLISTPIFSLYMIFFIWRTIGTILYFAFESDIKVFIIFPNVAEYLALFYYLFAALSIKIDVATPLFVALVLVVKILHEIQVHYIKYNTHLPESQTPWYIKFHSKLARSLIP